MSRQTSTDLCPASFLTEAKYVNASTEELKLAAFCIDYLNLPACRCEGSPTEKRVLNGDYVFIDYAVIYWLQHLEACVTLSTSKDGDGHEDEELMEELAESLKEFIDQHWAAPTSTLALAKRFSNKLQFFRRFGFYDRLEKVVASTRKQWNYFGNMEKKEIALNLVDLVGDVRKILERMISDPVDPSTERTINERYGNNLFKCPRFSCKFFSQGFPSRAEREAHVSKHERPFRCTEETCHGYFWGFASEADRKKHMDENHSSTSNDDTEFPTDQDIEHSIMTSHKESHENQEPELMSQDTGESERLSEVESEPNAYSRRQVSGRQNKPRQIEFRCEDCHKVFKKRHNLNSHLQTHGIEQPYECHTCGTRFARQSDLNRHVNIHKGEKFECRGCRRSFSRKDTLSKHYESRVGRECVKVRPDTTTL